MATKTAFVTQISKNGITFSGRTDSKHWLTMDGPVAFGGADAGIRPKELMLLALAGCTGSDVASILAKKRVPLDRFELAISAEETEEHPKVFTSMHIEYRFFGTGLQAQDLERAINLSLDKYCGVTAMYRKAMDITHSYTISEAE
ncbi:MAG: OsmC family protein [Ignavibacteriae bacterium]|nr:OsmC family protein [Ignavibacteriota bacterium]